MSEVHHYQHFIAGKEARGAGELRLERFHPATNERVATYARGTAQDVDRAAQAARDAFRGWGRTSRAERAALLRRAADLIQASAQTLATIESAETGKLPADALGDIMGGADLWRQSATELLRLEDKKYHDLDASYDATVSIEPVGVVALILPWNFPFIVSAERLPFILAAGCAVVAKPSEYTSGTSLALGPILKQAGFPDGVYNVVTGLGTEVGAPLVNHPDVAMISFTGSSANGKRIMAEAAQSLKRVSLELGGKGPIVVFADADLDKAVAGIVQGFTHNAGQCCISTSRLLVEASAADAVKHKLCAALSALGVPQPVATEAQYQRVKHFVDVGKKEASVLFEGKIPEGQKGLFIAPIVFEKFAPDAAIVREEIFGPVLCLQTFSTEQEAIDMANDTVYGLSASVWTGDLVRGQRVLSQIRAGRQWLNTLWTWHPGIPMGGFGQSGIGREAGDRGILTYSELRSTFIGRPLSPQ